MRVAVGSRTGSYFFLRTGWWAPVKPEHRVPIPAPPLREGRQVEIT